MSITTELLSIENSVSYKETEKISKKDYFKTYTIVFVFMTLFMFSLFWINQRTFIWKVDGWSQHYKALIYYSEWLKLLLKNFIINHNFDIPTFTLGMGFGADLYNNLHFYVIGDLLSLVAAVFPVKYMAILYCLLIIARFYFAGIAFSYYCFYTCPKSKYAVLGGSFLYIFCGFALVAAFRHPFFINPMIYFPLLLLGVEKIFKENKPFWFIGAVFFSAISNFYFFYMLAVMTIIYIVFKLFFCVRDMKKAGKLFFKFGMCALLGSLLGAFILYPVVLQLLSDTRVSSVYEYSGFGYPLSYYRSFLTSFPGVDSPGYWNYMGFGGFSLLTLFVFLITWQKQDNFLKYYFLLLTIFLLLPAAGRLMNGFSYVSNRWVWAYSFVVALIAVSMWEQLYDFEQIRKWKVVLSLILYVVINILFDNAFTKSSIFQLLLTAVLFLIIVYRKKFSCLQNKESFSYLLSVFLLVSLIANGFFSYATFGRGYIREYPYTFSNVNSRLENNEVKALKDAVDTCGFYRFSASEPLLTENANLLYGISSTQYYWSLTNSKVTEFFSKMSVLDNIMHRLQTFDGRTLLNEIASIKYNLTRNEESLPFGYDLLKPNIYKNMSLYENRFALPLGYTYKHYIAPAEYNQMDSVQKQQAVLQGVVIDEGDVEKEYEKAIIQFEDYDIPYKLNYDKNTVTKVGNAFVVTKKNAVVNFSFKGKSNCETYLYVKGLEFKGVNEFDLYKKYGTGSEFDPLDIYTEKHFERLKDSEKNKLSLNKKYWTEPYYLNITVRAFSDKKAFEKKQLLYTTHSCPWPSGRHDFIVNTYYSNKPKTKIQIKFPHIGKYSFDEIKVVCQQFRNYPKYMKNLKESTLTNIDLHNNNPVFATNFITGEINLKTNKVLLLTIPYSKGWHAYVDDKPVEIYQANTMFMALKLEPGHHKIKLTYKTRGLREGVLLTALGLVLLVVFVYSRRSVSIMPR